MNVEAKDDFLGIKIVTVGALIASWALPHAVRLAVRAYCRLLWWWSTSDLRKTLAGVPSSSYGPFSLFSVSVGGRDRTLDFLRLRRSEAGVPQTRLTELLASLISAGEWHYDPEELVYVSYGYQEDDWELICSARSVLHHNVKFPPYSSPPRVRDSFLEVQCHGADVTRTVSRLAGPDQSFYKHIAPDVVPLERLLRLHPLVAPLPDPLRLKFSAGSFSFFCAVESLQTYSAKGWDEALSVLDDDDDDDDGSSDSGGDGAGEGSGDGGDGEGSEEGSQVGGEGEGSDDAPSAPEAPRKKGDLRHGHGGNHAGGPGVIVL